MSQGQSADDSQPVTANASNMNQATVDGLVHTKFHDDKKLQSLSTSPTHFVGPWWLRGKKAEAPSVKPWVSSIDVTTRPTVGPRWMPRMLRSLGTINALNLPPTQLTRTTQTVK